MLDPRHIDEVQDAGLAMIALVRPAASWHRGRAQSGTPNGLAR